MTPLKFSERLTGTNKPHSDCSSFLRAESVTESMLYTVHNHNYLWSKPLNVFWVVCLMAQGELTTSSPLSRHPSFPWLSLVLCLQCSSAFLFLSFSSFMPSATSLSQQKLPRSPALQGRPSALTITSPLHITVVMHTDLCAALYLITQSCLTLCDSHRL